MDVKLSAMENKADYSDILYKPAFKSKNHPAMNSQNRAAQFAPFAALTGYEEALEKAGEKAILDFD